MEYSAIPSTKFDDVINLLRCSFADEPLNVSVGLCKYGKPCDLLEQHDLMTMRHGFSIMAVDSKTGEIAGVSLNGISRRGDVEKELKDMENIDCLEYHRIFGLLFSVNRDLDLFTKYGVDKIFEMCILSVGSKYRGRGLAQELFLRSEWIAEAYGFELLKVDATSYFTQRICDKQGFVSVKDVRYKDFKDELGKLLYDIESPHDYYKVMVKKLQPRKN